MTEKVYNFGEVVQSVAAIVLGRGLDYADLKAARGNPCSYVVDGRDAEGDRCVIGEFWHRAGVSDEDLEPLDKLGTIESVRVDEALPVLTTRRAYEFLSTCQRLQDLATKYGDMLVQALTEPGLFTLDDVEPYTSTVYGSED